MGGVGGFGCPWTALNHQLIGSVISTSVSDKKGFMGQILRDYPRYKSKDYILCNAEVRKCHEDIPGHLKRLFPQKNAGPGYPSKRG